MSCDHVHFSCQIHMHINQWKGHKHILAAPENTFRMRLRHFTHLADGIPRYGYIYAFHLSLSLSLACQTTFDINSGWCGDASHETLSLRWPNNSIKYVRVANGKNNTIAARVTPSQIWRHHRIDEEKKKKKTKPKNCNVADTILMTKR